MKKVQWSTDDDGKIDGPKNIESSIREVEI